MVPLTLILVGAQLPPSGCCLKRRYLKATRGTIPRERLRNGQCMRAPKVGVAEFEEKYSPTAPSPALFEEQTLPTYFDALIMGMTVKLAKIQFSQ